VIKNLLITVAVLLMFGCDNPKLQVEKQLRPVRTLTVSSPATHIAHEFTAVVDASRKADLSFKVSGEIIEFPVNQGDEVRVGQIIAKLDDKDINIQLQESRSTYDKVKADYERGKNLIGSSTISQADFDQLNAQFNSAKAKLESATNNLNYTKLKVSFDGVIAKKYTEKFQEVLAKTPIVALHDLKNIHLKIDIPESIMIRIQRSETPTDVRARFDGIKDIEFPLTFKEVSTQANDVTGTYEVTYTMNNSMKHTILPGMTAKVIVHRLQSLENTKVKFYLPVKTVLKDIRGNYVFLVETMGNGIGRIKRQQVMVGDITQMGIEIYSGISLGNKVISAGMTKVSDGMKVKSLDD